MERQEPLWRRRPRRQSGEHAGRRGPGPQAGADRRHLRLAQGAGITLSFLKHQSVKLKELAIYSRQLSVLIDAELPLIQSLNILAEQTNNAYFKKVISSVREDVEAGSSLNQAKRKFPKVFDDLYCNLIASGEQSGSLDTMLSSALHVPEKAQRLERRVQIAIVYPILVMTITVLISTFLMVFIVPIFAAFFQNTGVPLPLHPYRRRDEQRHGQVPGTSSSPYRPPGCCTTCAPGTGPG